jgi:O-acetyl-ADP-ribose deacetylase (regulator of RNase III)
MYRFSVLKGDITTLNVDAIVNAANNSLLGGGGVDGAIHRAAGPALLEECRHLNGCKTGEAKITGGYNLPAKYVIHTVGPVWHGGDHGEDQLLANCYRNCLLIAAQKELETVAFPSVSTGVYRFPLERAARIAIDNIHSFLVNDQQIQKVIMVAFDDITYEQYQKAAKSIKRSG